MSKTEEKAALRREIRRMLRELAAWEIDTANAAMTESMKSLPAYKNAKTIFCYISTGREPDTRELLRDMQQRGIRIAVPLCTAPGIMEARLINGMQDVIIGSFGLLEPKGESEKVLPSEIDFAVIPCLTCGRDGSRLGKGGGYYDRFLKEKTYQAAVLCYEQLLKDTVPCDPWDQRTDYTVTQKGIYRNV